MSAPLDLSRLNDRQRAIATTLDAPLFVEAGAGSGKTFTLTQRIAWALSPGSGADGRPFLDSLDQVLVITFTKDGSDDYMGGSATGSHVTVNDASGVSADIDIQVNYSLDPSKAVDIYRDYGTQENFVKSVAAIDARSVPREVSGQFDTITMLTDRGAFTQAVQDELGDICDARVNAGMARDLLSLGLSDEARGALEALLARNEGFVEEFVAGAASGGAD